MKSFFLSLLLSFTISNLFAQKLSGEEMKLYNLIMEYRKSKSLQLIPISHSLNLVAQMHVNDLQNNSPDDGHCNMHSWSSKGNWTPCCYTADHAHAYCMWSKPGELTAYKGNGYEIAIESGDSLTATSAFETWKASSAHNAVITNQSVWKDLKWNAIGLCLSRKYAVVWFGEQPDK